jgi:hypothetical protein
MKISLHEALFSNYDLMLRLLSVIFELIEHTRNLIIGMLLLIKCDIDYKLFFLISYIIPVIYKQTMITGYTYKILHCSASNIHKLHKLSISDCIA